MLCRSPFTWRSACTNCRALSGCGWRISSVLVLQRQNSATSCLGNKSQQRQPIRLVGRAAEAPPAGEEATCSAPAGDALTPAASVASGTFIGALALITSNTVGAGMLALPSFTVPAGLAPSAALLVATWGLLTLEALLIAEVNLAVGEALRSGGTAEGSSVRESDASSGDSERIVTLRQMVEHTLGGSIGKGLVAFYLSLSACFLVAYTCKSTEVLDFFSGGSLAPALAAPTFAGAMAALMFLGGNAVVDKVNQGLTTAILGLFLLILGSGVFQVDWAAAHTTSDWGAATKAVPIAFMALFYHDLVPVICAYLGHDRASVRSAILLGGLMPLAMFLSWEAVALNLLPAGLAGAPTAVGAAQGSGSAPMVDLLEAFVRRSPPLVCTAVESFSGLAVVTCYLGTTLGMSETLRTELPLLLAGLQGPAPGPESGAQRGQQRQQGQLERAVAGVGRGGGGLAWLVEGEGLRGLALGMSLGPPLLFTLARPDLFLGALDVAGAYGLLLLYGLLPPLMAWKLRGQQQQQASNSGSAGCRGQQQAQLLTANAQSALGSFGPLVPGGVPVLAALLAIVGTITASRIASDLGVPLDGLVAQLQHMATGALTLH